MPHAVVDVSTKTLLGAALVMMLGALTVFGGVLWTAGDAGPEIREGEFALPTAENTPLAFTGQTCSTDADCPETQCVGTDYYVDQDGSGECKYNERRGEYQCADYDKVYSDAKFCGGSTDYLCDEDGCESYKAACEEDCSNNRGCDMHYDFCGSDNDDSTSSGSTSSCTDQCESLIKKCDGSGNIVQCQDTDSDSCTDGFVKIDNCDEGCENAACVVTDTTEETAEEANPEDDTDDTDTSDGQTLDERITEVWTGVWTTLFGWL